MGTGMEQEIADLMPNTLCFKGIGTLILACTEDIFSILDQKIHIIFQSDQLKN